MYLTTLQTIIMIAVIAFGMIITRFSPFILFPDNKKIPKIISFLGDVLSPAMIGLLVVYQLKNVNITNYPHGIPEFIAVIVVALLQYYKKSVLLSIGLGTALYMLLVQEVFIL